MKIHPAFFILLGFLALITINGMAINPYPQGDVNQDGVVNDDDIKALVEYLLGKGLLPGNPDSNGDLIINIGDLAKVIIIINITPTPTPTPTPTETPTPTPTPTETPATFNIKDYFILSQNSWWHYSAIDEGSPDDNFRWDVLTSTINVGTYNATQIKTTTDEATDERNKDRDFWVLKPNGDLMFYGYHEGGVPARDPKKWHVLSQDVILTDPILFGTDGLTIGQTINDTGAGTIDVQAPDGIPLFGAVINDVPITVTAETHYVEFRDNVETNMGKFNHVLVITVDTTGSVGGYFPMTFFGNTFFLKQNVGLIVQNQKPDQNDAEKHAIDSGQAGGVTIAPDVTPTPTP